MKLGSWQVQIREQGRYKTTFIVPFGHYEWNVMLFELKNLPYKFQNIMNNIFNFYFKFIIVYINDISVFSESLQKHFVYLKKFFNLIKENGVTCYTPNMKLFQTKIKFLGHEIYEGMKKAIQRSIEFIDKFSYEIKDNKQLQKIFRMFELYSSLFQRFKNYL